MTETKAGNIVYLNVSNEKSPQNNIVLLGGLGGGNSPGVCIKRMRIYYNLVPDSHHPLSPPPRSPYHIRPSLLLGTYCVLQGEYQWNQAIFPFVLRKYLFLQGTPTLS